MGPGGARNTLLLSATLKSFDGNWRPMMWGIHNGFYLRKCIWKLELFPIFTGIYLAPLRLTDCLFI